MPKLYLISPPHIPELFPFIDKVKQAIDTGKVATFQLRLKDISDDDLLFKAEAIYSLCYFANIPFYLNDRPDLAKAADADGVHVGADDMSGDREGLKFGVSCYDSQERALEAQKQDADYVSFGAFFPSKTKQSRGKPSPDILSWWKSQSSIPSVAIGGITPENIQEVSSADYTAVISYIWDHPEGVAKAIESFGNSLEEV